MGVHKKYADSPLGEKDSNRGGNYEKEGKKGSKKKVTACIKEECKALRGSIGLSS
jgi:hypothetical protein